MLDERDTQIQELQERNVELEGIVESYKSVDNDMRELRNLVKNGHKMNDEYNKMNREYNQMKKDFKRDLNKLLRRSK